MTDKTYNLGDDKSSYRSPQAKEIPMTLQCVLCQSFGTEKFGMSTNSYDEEDWE